MPPTHNLLSSPAHVADVPASLPQQWSTACIMGYCSNRHSTLFFLSPLSGAAAAAAAAGGKIVPIATQQLRACLELAQLLPVQLMLLVV